MDPNEGLSLAASACYTIVYTMLGEGVLLMNDFEYPLKPANSIICSLGRELLIRNSRSVSLLLCVVCLSGDRVIKSVEESLVRIDECCVIANPRVVSGILQHFIEMDTILSEVSKHSKFLLLDLLLLQMVEYPKKKSLSHQTYERILTIMDACYSEFSSIGEISEYMHITPAYMSRLFRKYDNIRPYEKLRLLKMEKAVSLLLQRKYLVKEVAAKVGYRNPLHFSQEFKKFLGRSPTDYLRQ